MLSQLCCSHKGHIISYTLHIIPGCLFLLAVTRWQAKLLKPLSVISDSACAKRSCFTRRSICAWFVMGTDEGWIQFQNLHEIWRVHHCGGCEELKFLSSITSRTYPVNYLIYWSAQNWSCADPCRRLSKNSINFPWYLIPFLYLAVNTQSFLPQHPFFSHALYKLLIDLPCEKLSTYTTPLVCARCPHVGSGTMAPFIWG